jgi:hypothetical protein
MADGSRADESETAPPCKASPMRVVVSLPPPDAPSVMRLARLLVERAADDVLSRR